MCIAKINAESLLILLTKHFDDLFLTEILELGYHLDRLLDEQKTPFGVNFEDIKQVADRYDSSLLEYEIEELLIKKHIVPILPEKEQFDLKNLKVHREECLTVFKDVITRNRIDLSAIDDLESMIDDVSELVSRTFKICNRKGDSMVTIEGKNFKSALNNWIKKLRDGDDDFGLMGLDLSGRDLSGIDFTGVVLFAAKFSYSDLTDADLSNTDLRHVDFTGTIFNRTNLTGATGLKDQIINKQAES